MYSEIKRSAWYRLTAWLLTVCLVITLIPDISHATGAGGGTKISPEDVTEKNVTGRTEDTTTYDLGEGEKMTVFHGGQVRYEDEEGELIDYDRSLVKIKTGEKKRALTAIHTGTKKVTADSTSRSSCRKTRR